MADPFRDYFGKSIDEFKQKFIKGLGLLGQDVKESPNVARENWDKMSSNWSNNSIPSGAVRRAKRAAASAAASEVAKETAQKLLKKKGLPTLH